MKLTKFEKGWLRLFGVLGALIAIIFLVQPLLPLSPSSSHQDQPLADPASLKLLLSGKPLPTPKEEPTGEFQGRKVTPPPLASLASLRRVLGLTTDEEKRIEVDLTNQRVYAFEGSRKVYEFVVSTGKWGRTPTGEFTIWAKVKSQKMSGGSGNTYYYLPNVPWVMFFSNNQVDASRGFSLHGTYWHNNFGHPMSHGCVNMRIEDAKILYEWATPVVTDDKAWSVHAAEDNPGTKVIIYGVTPEE